ncbi:MAG: DUF362 domain-containing protein [Nitrospirae bacterium]|nr:MAG: DUF362 domain-containing protein [Nitrospirota bacterium]
MLYYSRLMSKVIIKKSTYSYDILKPRVFELMDALGGELIKKNSYVVIKPNLLAPAPPDKAIVTHPLVIKAAAEYVLQKGARPQISDSSAMGSFQKVISESGIKDALKELDVEFREFKTSLKVDIGEPFGKIEIAEDALNADFLINLPKLKTHMQMMLTLGVKNLFGCIVGMRKPEWHFRTGVDREMFAKLLINIYKAVSPSMTLIDGILAMEGQGPGRRGTPKHLGVLMGSRDAIALDIAICKMLGIHPDKLLTNKLAKDMGLAGGKIQVEGDFPEIRHFKMPVITPLVFGPQKLHRLMRKHLVQRPVCDDSICRLCGECWKYCPAKAISRERKNLRFDYDKCIRCYCCIEVCPHAALQAKETLPGKVLRKVLKRGH